MIAEKLPLLAQRPHIPYTAPTFKPACYDPELAALSNTKLSGCFLLPPPTANGSPDAVC